MAIDNKIMLITYADSMGGDLKSLSLNLDTHFKGALGAVHILPFFPSSADRGFAPMRYDQVDPAFGDWSDIQQLSEHYQLMFDFMVNHISQHSPHFQDFLAKKDESEWKDLFIRYKDFWPGGEPTPAQVDAIYKRKPKAPYFEAQFADGSREKVWCTFGDEQIDLDVTTPVTRAFIRDTLLGMIDHGAAMIRLDAFAYAIKKVDSNCFFVEPEIWDLLHDIEALTQEHAVSILPEIHEHYSIQLKIADQGFPVYDFALPMLVLHTIYAKSSDRLRNWLEICPRNQFTTLDTHDGIGVVDVRDLLSDEEIEATREALFTRGANVKKVYNTTAYNNLDIYQINCTYYSALGDHDDAYLLSRAIQFFAPGIPQVYYVGMLAGRNDIERIEKTKEGREINRHSYTNEEIAQEVQRPVVQSLIELMRFRNQHPAFLGDITVLDTPSNKLAITWRKGADYATLRADLDDLTFEIEASPII
jgi:sucrose phosphorylase